MKTLFRRFFEGTLVGILLCCSSVHAAQNHDPNLAALNQILASVPPGQKLARVGDMQILVANLTAWRDQLAGNPSPQSAFTGEVPTWTEGKVYYEFSNVGTNAVPPRLQKAFTDAAGEWAMFANLHFIPHTTQSNYVTVQVDNTLEGGFSSAVGMIGGQQFLSISPNAWNRGTLCHEIGHVLGLVHEHQRSDRDSFVTIISSNVVEGGLGNFVLLPDSRNQGPYDFLSVMHYARNYLSVSSNLDTIMPLPAYTQFINVMGQPGPVTLSAGDRAGMALVYGAAPELSSVVTNTQDSGIGSLRAALYYAFDNPHTVITFNVFLNDPGLSNGIITIQPSDQLPSLVNGTTLGSFVREINTNSNTTEPIIQINGALCPRPSTFANGVRIAGSNCVVVGLTINGFAASGIVLDGTNAQNNLVTGCFLGVDSTGMFAVTNGLSPITLQNGTHGNIVGNTFGGGRNLISGGVFQGIVLRDPGTTQNRITGNWIGLNATGTAAIPNGFSGVGIVGGANNNFIGGFNPGEGNVISGNTIQGVAIRDPGTILNSIVGNIIGLNPAGTAAISNGAAGVEIFMGAQNNFIGGAGLYESNVISGNGVQGVLIDGDGTSGNSVKGNYIGLNAAGTSAIPNGGAGVGIFAGAQNNTIGDSSFRSRNIISGNTLQGVAIGNAGTSFNSIIGNYIGLDAAGTFAIPNTFPGVNLFDGATLNSIGGVQAGFGNVISGNAGQGVSLQDAGTSSNSIQGNLIGLNAAGDAAVPNTGVGVELFFSANQNTIDGRNVISGNHDDGVLMDNGASSNTVAGNYIGLDVAGINAIPNAGSGVEMFFSANGNLIGGSDGRNVIAGNNKSGVLIDDGVTGEVVQGNTIGLNVAGTATPNLNAGVGMFGGVQGNVIGGVLPGQANLIADNAGGGVELYDDDTTNNTIRGNSIYGNQSGFGIYLFEANNAGSESTPSLIGTFLGTNLLVSGNLPTTIGGTFHLDFYASPPPAFSAQGETYIGGMDVLALTNNTVGFSAHLAAIVPVGQIITATATDPSGNTSMFSAGVPVTTLDAVGDGIPDLWRATHFGGTGNSTNAQSCATCDADNDGFNNRQEFLAGTDPNNAASNLRIGSVALNDTGAAVSFASVSGIIYRVEYKNSLTANGWTLLADQIVGTGSTIQVTDFTPITPTQRFYRVDVLP